ncbi:MAG: PspC domain-containing protein [Gammaproteobacteria bacterium]|nr:PspC domain-containing protein [Gammaproteobacteria bacterium]
MANPTMNRIRSGIRLDKKNGWIAGICAGLANYLDTDPAFVRVGVIVTALFLPKIVIATYLVAWLLIDEG